jgi:hypothetical protein
MMVAALAGCSNNKPSLSSSNTATAGTAHAGPAVGQARVVVVAQHFLSGDELSHEWWFAAKSL